MHLLSERYCKLRDYRGRYYHCQAVSIKLHACLGASTALSLTEKVSSGLFTQREGDGQQFSFPQFTSFVAFIIFHSDRN